MQRNPNKFKRKKEDENKEQSEDQTLEKNLKEITKEQFENNGKAKGNLLVHLVPVEFSPRKKIPDADSNKITTIRKVDSVIVADFKDGSAVYVMIEKYQKGVCGLDFARHKRRVHETFKEGKTDSNDLDMPEIKCDYLYIEGDIKKKCEEKGYSTEKINNWRGITGNPYVFSIFFSDEEMKDQEKSYFLDPNLVFYTIDDYDNIDDDNRIGGLEFNTMPFNEDVELRSNYSSWFSWSLVLVNGDFTQDVFVEYLIMEIELQKKWNSAYRYYKKLDKDDFWTRKFNVRRNKSLEELDDFEMKLNSLDESHDSDRVMFIKEKLIESSKIRKLISQSRTKLEKRRDGMALTVSLFALFFALASVIVVIISKFF